MKIKFLIASYLLVVLTDIFALLFFLGGYLPMTAVIFLIMLSPLLLIGSTSRTFTLYSFDTYLGKSILFTMISAVSTFFGVLTNMLKLYAGEIIMPLGYDDIFYSISMVCLVIGFYFAIKGNKIGWDPEKKRIFRIWAVLLVTLLSVSLYLALGNDLLHIGPSLAYLTFSSILSLFALRLFLVTWGYRRGAVFLAWLGIFAGAALLIGTTFTLFITVRMGLLNQTLTFIPLVFLAVTQATFAFGIMALGVIAQDIQKKFSTLGRPTI